MKTSSPSQSQSSSHKLYQLADLEPDALFLSRQVKKTSGIKDMFSNLK